ncbi:MAG: succinate dehydrogenase iron-sulfur subunit, partial [Rubrivivax sp.]
CRSILNCTDVCPKALDPAGAISQIRGMMVRRAV